MELKKNAERWGWKKSKNGLIPVTTLEPPAPENLLHLISCKCKKGCRGSCGCRKAGLKCSVICANCSGTCDNSENPLPDSDEEEESETVFQQIYDEIEDEGDDIEEDNPIADNVEELPIREVLLGSVDEELPKPGPSGIAKRRRMH